MPLDFYKKEEQKLVVSNYIPSEDWSKFTHITLSTEKDDRLIASVGYFQKIEGQEPYKLEDYLENAKDIQLAKVFCRAMDMLELLKEIKEENRAAEYHLEEIQEIVDDVEDIEEEVKRLLPSSSDLSGGKSWKIIKLIRDFPKILDMNEEELKEFKTEHYIKF